ncbi:tetratricopeptide repeat protein [Methylococcus geothermalis]|nr:tetratricopeptide repeat protein [Methylococcus geothermalis]
MLNLAQALLQGLRASRDAGEAARAEALIQRALTLAPRDSRAWALKAWDEMNRHRFREALVSVRQAHGLGVPSAMTLGLESDALVELGRYEDALAVTQKLLDAFPGLPAYSRAAHLRFLHGDIEGAVGLLNESLAVAPPGSEAHAWAFVQLAELHLNGGQFERAENALARAETLFPGRPDYPALRARVREAQGKREEALALLREALDQYPSPDDAVMAWRLARSVGDHEAMRRLALLLDGMARLDEAGDKLFRRAFAEYYALQGHRYGEAERLAREECLRRPDIYGHALLAFVLRQAGKHREADRHGQTALRLGTADRRLERWARPPRAARTPTVAAKRSIADDDGIAPFNPEEAP